MKCEGGIEFFEETGGPFEIWEEPDEYEWKNRYLVVVDIGGRGHKSDWSVITVFDRMNDSELPAVVAQWRGHDDYDKIAQTAASIGEFYQNALLVIESNSLETRDRERYVDGEQAPFILQELADLYPNLYMRVSPGGTARPGFHTNSSTKPMVIGTLVKMVREGLYIERDMKAIEELIQYERKSNGSYGAYIGCHDDILMTRAIGLHIHEHEMEPPVRRPWLLKKKNNRYRGPQDAFGIF